MRSRRRRTYVELEDKEALFMIIRYIYGCDTRDLAELGVICVPSSFSALTRCGVQSYRLGISSVGAQERRRYPVRARREARCKH